MATGTALFDFGTSQVVSAILTVTNQTTIVAGSRVEAFVRLEATATHSIDEHRIENLKFTCGNIVASTSFDIYGDVTLGSTQDKFNVDWVWV